MVQAGLGKKTKITRAKTARGMAQGKSTCKCEVLNSNLSITKRKEKKRKKRKRKELFGVGHGDK
jgi:hypothetical protein